MITPYLHPISEIRDSSIASTEIPFTNCTTYHSGKCFGRSSIASASGSPTPAKGHGRQLPIAQSAAKDAGGSSQPYLPYPAAQQQRHQNVSALMERRVQENRRE